MNRDSCYLTSQLRRYAPQNKTDHLLVIVERTPALAFGGLSATDLWFRSAIRYFLPGILHATDRGVLHDGGPHSRRCSSIS